MARFPILFGQGICLYTTVLHHIHRIGCVWEKFKKSYCTSLEIFTECALSYFINTTLECQISFPFKWKATKINNISSCHQIFSFLLLLTSAYKWIHRVYKKGEKDMTLVYSDVDDIFPSTWAPPIYYPNIYRFCFRKYLLPIFDSIPLRTIRVHYPYKMFSSFLSIYL